MSKQKDMEGKSWQTKAVRGGVFRTDLGEMGEPIFMTSAFAYDSAEEAEARFDGRAEGFTYSRQTNPTVTMLEARMAELEGAEMGRATATGMAAMSAALLSSLKAGDHVVAARALFGSCRWLVDTLLPRYGIETTIVDATNLDEWQAAIRPNTKLFFTETPSNPGLEIVDMAAVADIAHKAGAIFVVDNVFASPVLQKPMDFGADIVAYSATNHIDGQGRALGGMVLCSKAFDDEYLYPYYRHTGCAMSPFNAWVLLKSYETLALRVHAMCDSAERVAEMLEGRLGTVRYPGLDSFPQRDLAMKQMARGGTMIAFEFDGGRDQAFTFMNALKLLDISNNLGDSRSIATHPWSTTHKALEPETRAELGITEGLIRLSIGLEGTEDVRHDISEALKVAGV